MPPSELLARTTSQELSGYMALFHVKGEEAEHRRNVAESEDGIVHYYGRDDEPEDGDGSAEQ